MTEDYRQPDALAHVPNEMKASGPLPPLRSGALFGFWRSARGENHGRNSQPGDLWHEEGDITDTDRIDYLEKHAAETWSNGGAGDGPATWYCTRLLGERLAREACCFSGPTIRAAIDAALLSSPTT